MSKSRFSAADRAESIAVLREHFRPGDTVYCVLRSVARSGMSRVISFLTIRDDELRLWDYHIAQALGQTLDKREGIKVSGCGMDMGFSVVYDLGRTLWPDGTPEPHGTRNGAPDRDGGYALKHRWL